MPSYGSTDTILTRQGGTPDQFGFANQTELEAFVDDLRARASSEVEEFCERVFGVEQGETETRQGTGTDTIRVRNYPIVAVNSVTVGRSTLDASAYQIVQSSGRPNRNAGLIERTDRRVFPVGRRVTIDYDWGFQETPGVVKAVVEDMVVEVLEKAVVDRESSGKSSESMDGYSISWDNSDAEDYLRLDESKRQRLEGLARQGVA